MEKSIWKKRSVNLSDVLHDLIISGQDPCKKQLDLYMDVMDVTDVHCDKTRLDPGALNLCRTIVALFPMMKLFEACRSSSRDRKGSEMAEIRGTADNGIGMSPEFEEDFFLSLRESVLPQSAVTQGDWLGNGYYQEYCGYDGRND